MGASVAARSAGRCDAAPRFIVKRNVREVYGDPDAVTDETIGRYHDLLLREGHREAMVKYFRTLRKYSVDDSLVRHVPEIGAREQESAARGGGRAAARARGWR